MCGEWWALLLAVVGGMFVMATALIAWGALMEREVPTAPAPEPSTWGDWKSPQWGDRE